MRVLQSIDTLISGKEEKSLLKQLFEIGQLDRILNHPSFSLDAFKALLKTLAPVDTFYKELGGIKGYHQKVLGLLFPEKEEISSPAFFHPPSFTDISHMSAKVQQTVQWGIEAMRYVAEIIPLGGAADRLHLVDEKTGRELPAALLKFAGKTLLERLIEDIQAQEFLYYKKFGEQITVPLALMTSFEKDNHFHVEKILEESNWFGRPKESIRIFTQPLVPVVDEKGDWLLLDDLKLVMKPGGHGVIWKQADDTGIFSWFEELGKTKLLVRQINNPIAGLDFGLLSFLGIGWKENKKFGFASCPRLVKSAEGVNVLVEKEGLIAITNIEYCDFQRFGIEDLPLKEGEPYSRFSSNTNLLFGDLASIREAVRKCPFPGLLLNMKKGFFTDSKGVKGQATLGRLESTMQNLADVFLEKKDGGLSPKNTFITYNHRHKTISTAKRAYCEGGSLQETPEACFYDLLFAARDLLEGTCGFTLPLRRSIEEYLSLGPEFVFLYHPSLGPQYLEMQKKLKGGVFSLGSDLFLEISDLLIENLEIDGSLRILADQVMGFRDKRGRCVLKNVKVCNRGVDWARSRPFWRGAFHRHEGVEIILHGNAQVIAEDIVFKGSHRFEVQDGSTLHLRQGEKGIVEELF